MTPCPAHPHREFKLGEEGWTEFSLSLNGEGASPSPCSEFFLMKAPLSPDRCLLPGSDFGTSGLPPLSPLLAQRINRRLIPPLPPFQYRRPGQTLNSLLDGLTLRPARGLPFPCKHSELRYYLFFFPIWLLGEVYPFSFFPADLTSSLVFSLDTPFEIGESFLFKDGFENAAPLFFSPLPPRPSAFFTHRFFFVSPSFLKLGSMTSNPKKRVRTSLFC